MKIAELIAELENIASPGLQETYDNAGLITGDKSWECTGILVSLDTTEEVVMEAISNKCNLIISHHPIVFRGIKKLDHNNYADRALIAAIKNDIALYAIHTNLDNVLDGVSGKMASLLKLKQTSILEPKMNTLKKISCFVPVSHEEQVRSALFEAGAGKIGDYSECSFSLKGTGNFKAGVNANPFTGKQGERHYEEEIRIETVFPSHRLNGIINALKSSHPYEEPAFDIYALENAHPGTGSGVIGKLEKEMTSAEFLQTLKSVFNTPIIRHSAFINRNIKTVALCGGAGSFLISRALKAGADAFVTADLKYHEFFDANGGMLLADIGHFESEQFTIDLISDILAQKFLNFAVLKTGIMTNPVHYFQ